MREAACPCVSYLHMLVLNDTEGNDSAFWLKVIFMKDTSLPPSTLWVFYSLMRKEEL